MKKIALFRINYWGELPYYVDKIVNNYNQKEATPNAIYNLDHDISFCVCDLREAHGNLNKFDKSAWLSPRKNDNSFNVTISFK